MANWGWLRLQVNALSLKQIKLFSQSMMAFASSGAGAMCQLAWLHYRGYLRIHEDIQEGIEAFPNALQKLFIGGHTGKMLCRVASET